MKACFKTFCCPEDPQKAILPTLIYVRVSDVWVDGFSITLGWWHWGVGFYFAFSGEHRFIEK